MNFTGLRLQQSAVQSFLNCKYKFLFISIIYLTVLQFLMELK